MNKRFKKFEQVTRTASSLEIQKEVLLTDTNSVLHPFDERNIHPEISKISKPLFDDGHYSQSVFEAFKHIDKQVSKITKIRDSGFNLMMTAFNESKPKIQFSPLSSISNIDEQKGFRHIFAGSASGIRNPRGHEVGNMDSIEQCLDYLGLASMLLRKLNTRV